MVQVMNLSTILKTLHSYGIKSAVIEFVHDTERDVLTAVIKGAEATEHFCQMRLEGDLSVIQSHNMADAGFAAAALNKNLGTADATADTEQGTNAEGGTANAQFEGDISSATGPEDAAQ